MAPTGVNRPYSIRMDVTNGNDKREAFYIRSGTSSIVAKGEVLDELRDMQAVCLLMGVAILISKKRILIMY